MKQHQRNGCRYADVDLPAPESLCELEQRVDDSNSLFILAAADPDENGNRYIGLVMRQRSLILSKEDVDDLVIALVDARMELWGPDIEL